LLSSAYQNAPHSFQSVPGWQTNLFRHCFERAAVSDKFPAGCKLAHTRYVKYRSAFCLGHPNLPSKAQRGRSNFGWNLFPGIGLEPHNLRLPTRFNLRQ